jgi:hypothetical protein
MFCPTVMCGNSASDWNTMQVGAEIGGRFFYPLVAQPDLAFGDLVHPDKQTDQRRLAAARRPHDREELAFDDVEIDVLHSSERPKSLNDAA